MKPTFEELLDHAKMNAKSGESLTPEEEQELIAVFEAKCAALAAEGHGFKRFFMFAINAAFDGCDITGGFRKWLKKLVW